MISRIEFLYKHYDIEKRIQEKVKLNNKKIKYIIKQKEKGESSKKLAIIYGVTVRYINKIYFNYLEYGKNCTVLILFPAHTVLFIFSHFITILFL